MWVDVSRVSSVYAGRFWLTTKPRCNAKSISVDRSTCTELSHQEALNRSLAHSSIQRSARFGHRTPLNDWATAPSFYAVTANTEDQKFRSAARSVFWFAETDTSLECPGESGQCTVCISDIFIAHSFAQNSQGVLFCANTLRYSSPVIIPDNMIQV